MPHSTALDASMQEENALIGVQITAYYPAVSLSTLGSFVGSPLSGLVTTANHVWSLGAAASETLLDGGARSAAVSATRAIYDTNVANDRQVALTASRQVEAQLASLRILAEQERAGAIAVGAAQQTLNVLFNQ